MIESLEARRLYARMVVTTDNGILSITGTPRNDSIEIGVGRKELTLKLDGSDLTVPTKGLKAIRILGGRGDDYIIASPNLKIRVSVDGGSGNDQIGGGGSADTLSGGAGNDSIAGHDGADYLDGGSGDDILYDITGVNVFHGGGGNDLATDEGYRLGSGVEAWAQRGTPDPLFLTGTTDLKTINGRLTLIRRGNLPSASNTTSQSGPTNQGNGQYAVEQSLQLLSSPGNTTTYDDRWDVTVAAKGGLVFTYVVQTTEQFSIPFLLPTK